MNEGVLVDVCEEEVSVLKLLRRLQEMTNWRDRKAFVGKNTSFHGCEFELSVSLAEKQPLGALDFIFFSKKKYFSFSK